MAPISEDIHNSRILEINETILKQLFRIIPGCTENNIYESDKIPDVIFIECYEIDIDKGECKEYFLITDKEFLPTIKEIEWEGVKGYARRRNRRSINLHRLIIGLKPRDSDKAHHIGPLWDDRKHMIVKVAEEKHKEIHQRKRKPSSPFIVSDVVSFQKLRDYILF